MQVVLDAVVEVDRGGRAPFCLAEKSWHLIRLLKVRCQFMCLLELSRACKHALADIMLAAGLCRSGAGAEQLWQSTTGRSRRGCGQTLVLAALGRS